MLCPSAENGKIMIQHLVIECLITTPYLPNQLSKSHQEVYGMSEGSFNDHNDQSDLPHTHCAVLVLAKKKDGHDNGTTRDSF